jgi:hypothetical protein
MGGKKTEPKSEKESVKQEVLTEEEFLTTLGKVTRRVPKPSRETGKKRTSG